MHIKTSRRKNGEASYRVHVHYQGEHVTRVFRDLNAGKSWGRQQETAIERTGMPDTIEDRKKHTVTELVER